MDRKISWIISPCTMLNLRFNLFCRTGFHVDEFPDVTVQILEAVLVHEAVVLGLSMGRSAGGDGLANRVVDVIAALTGQTYQNFCAFRGIANCLGGELLELNMRQEHDINIFADDHARSRLIRELWIEPVPEFGEKLHGSL